MGVYTGSMSSCRASGFKVIRAPFRVPFGVQSRGTKVF